MADFSLNVKINGVDQAVNTVSQIEQALIATRNELKNVAIGSTAFEQLSTQAQTLQREFVNSYKETTNFSKGTRCFSFKRGFKYIFRYWYSRL